MAPVFAAAAFVIVVASASANVAVADDAVVA